MGELPEHGGDNSSRANSKSVQPTLRKAKLGGPMSLEELRLNRGLLQEIAAAKKAEVLGKDRTPPPDSNEDLS